jgi:3-oxoacyl-[acyl-carrier-protein] synthase-1
MSVFIQGHNIISPLGLSSQENFDAIKKGSSGVRIIEDEFYPEPTPLSKITEEQWQILEVKTQTRLESLVIQSISNACNQAEIELRKSSIPVILSTTKGNIDALSNDSSFNSSRAYLTALGQQIQKYFHLKTQPIVLSNACISGGCALELASDIIRLNQADTVVVCGADILSEFVVSGFRSFHAISDELCQPYDKNRKGINLGEAAATLVLGNKQSEIKLLSGSTSNDANHISGPSRTGEGLYLAIEWALREANLLASDIDYISAHGTATNYNDEMESIAFSRSDLLHAPVNSYKGYLGHTLGAAGILESIFAIECLRNNLLISSKGFEELGVSKPIRVIKKTEPKKLQYVLKTGSGFGGGNNALIFGKI